jgi:hypothetical protein
MEEGRQFLKRPQGSQVKAIEWVRTKKKFERKVESLNDYNI